MQSLDGPIRVIDVGVKGMQLKSKRVNIHQLVCPNAILVMHISSHPTPITTSLIPFTRTRNVTILGRVLAPCTRTRPLNLSSDQGRVSDTALLDTTLHTYCTHTALCLHGLTRNIQYSPTLINNDDDDDDDDPRMPGAATSQHPTPSYSTL